MLIKLFARFNSKLKLARSKVRSWIWNRFVFNIFYLHMIETSSMYSIVVKARPVVVLSIQNLLAVS